VEVTIEIRANVPDYVKRIVSENCRTFKFRECDVEAS